LCVCAGNKLPGNINAIRVDGHTEIIIRYSESVYVRVYVYIICVSLKDFFPCVICVAVNNVFGTSAVGYYYYIVLVLATAERYIIKKKNTHTHNTWGRRGEMAETTNNKPVSVLTRSLIHHVM